MSLKEKESNIKNVFLKMSSIQTGDQSSHIVNKLKISIWQKIWYSGYTKEDSHFWEVVSSNPRTGY